ncbi:hypothetical protein Aco04nite_93230 [Winogradskya consettensis]|uniref:Competence protein CoiA nuclease-like domain-containing protein n=1 Tax=Winogradskya consettensis TaxID=113560 RepID=A0A919W0V5_9ACTN|nr:hypothetical protein Aco04nite_93230 [Actinoplanes consettensis]
MLLVEFGTVLDLSREDLGVPELPGLWEQLHGKCKSGTLQCIDPQHPADAPPWLYLRQNEDGTREARHISGAEHATSGESDEHKALKERIAKAAEAGGFDAVIEDSSKNRRRRTDVLVRGDGVQIGFEPQLSPITAATVRRRSKLATDDGITPAWMTNSRTSKVIDQAPWARIDRKMWHEYLSDTELPVRGGVRGLVIEECSRMGTVCPDKKAGRPCSGWHASWSDARALERFDDLVIKAAARELVAVNVQRTATRSVWFWVPASDLEKVDSTTTGADDSPLGGIITRVDSRPRLRDQSCRYGQDSGHRPPASPDADREPVSVKLAEPMAPPTIGFLDWSGAAHWAKQALPCRICKKVTQVRDDQMRPCHKTCAESELWRG